MKPAKARIDKVLKLSFKLEYDDELGAVAVISAKTAVSNAILETIPQFLTKEQNALYIEIGSLQSRLGADQESGNG